MGDMEKLAMAQVKCIQCGASIGRGDKFCRHCGTQVPDNVQHIQIQVDNTADIMRAQYEQQESLLRQKKMKQAFRRRKTIWWLAGINCILFAVLFIIQSVINKINNTNVMGTTGFLACVCGAFALFFTCENFFSK